jgi:SNF2 family DNA or RNA helicase
MKYLRRRSFGRAHPPKALVYSQWEAELGLVSKALAMNAIPFVELKGSMQQRAQSLHRFSVDPSMRVFLLATGVANAGLTLVAATSVFILEPSLNPAIEEQVCAAGRRARGSPDLTVIPLWFCAQTSLVCL